MHTFSVNYSQILSSLNFFSAMVIFLMGYSQIMICAGLI